MMQTRRRGIQVRLKALKLLSLLPDLPSFSPPPSLPASLAHLLYVLCCIIAECFSYLSCVFVEGPAAVVLKSFTPSDFFFSLFFF